MRYTRQQRAKQRHFLYSIGVLQLLLGVPLFVIWALLRRWGIEAQKVEVLLYFALTSIHSGTVFGVWFCQIGWSRYWLIDLLFNQLSVLLAILGCASLFVGLIIFVGGVAEGKILIPLGYLLVIIGAFLAGLGMHFDSTSL